MDLVPLDSFKTNPRNPKGHDLGAIILSLRTHGFVDAPVIDDRTGQLLGGHGRVEALQAMRKAGEKPPDGIAVNGAGWMVPVQRARTRNDGQAAALMVALNRTVELGGTDEQKLADLLKDLAASGDIVGSGYDRDDLDQLLKDLGQNDKTEDEAPAPPKTPITKPGDLWLLGDHRLLCGDSTKPEDVARVMQMQKAALMATDPPYGVAYDSATMHKNGSAWDDIDGDQMDGPKLQAFLEQVFRTAVQQALRPDAAWYLWHAQMTQGFFAAAAAAAANLLLHRQIIWVKPALLFGRGDYHWRHELCFYGWVKGNRPPFYGERNQTTVWEIGNETSNGKREHPTQKPISLWDAPIRNHTKPGEILYEPFSGSGTQIIAAEKTERRCCAIEIAPAYVDVAVERWQKMAGKAAVRE